MTALEETQSCTPVAFAELIIGCQGRKLPADPNSGNRRPNRREQGVVQMEPNVFKL
jgi:hypothetical protein